MLMVIQVQLIMNSVAKHREALRNERRKQEINRLKSNIRNLIYYNSSSNRLNCGICQDDRWVTIQNTSNILELLVWNFNEKHICDKHLSTILQVAFRCLIDTPNIYCKLFITSNKSTKQAVIRKILLLLQLFDSKEMIGNERVWFEMEYGFQSKGQFAIKLMDCAYGFNEWAIMQQDENWDIQIKGICFTAVLNIFTRHPYLFVAYFDQYPLHFLLQKTKNEQTVHLLFLLRKIINSHKQQKSQQLHYHIYFGIKMFLASIKHMPQTLQSFTTLLNLINDLLRVGFVDEQFHQDVVCLIQNNDRLKQQTYSDILQVLQNLNSPSLPQQELEKLQEIRLSKSKMQVEQTKSMEIQ